MTSEWEERGKKNPETKAPKDVELLPKYKQYISNSLYIVHMDLKKKQHHLK